MHLYCAQVDLSQAGGVYGVPSENEDIYFHVLRADELLAQMFDGRFNNAAALICLLWLQINRSRLRKISAD